MSQILVVQRYTVEHGYSTLTTLIALHKSGYILSRVASVSNFPTQRHKGAKKKPLETIALCVFAWQIFFVFSFCAKPNVIFAGSLFQREAAHCVFADAAEVEGVVVFNDVGNLAVTVGGAVLEVFDDAAVRV